MRLVFAVTLTLLAATGGGPARAQGDDFDQAQARVLQSNLAGDFKTALAWAEKSLAIAEKRHGARSTQAASAHLSIAVQQQSLGRLAPAEEHYRKGLAMQEALVPAGDPSLSTFFSGLGGMLYGQGRYDEAEPLMRKSLELHEVLAKRFGNETGLAVALFMLGSNYTAMTRLDEGKRLLDRSLAAFERVMPQGGVQTAIVLNNLATNRQGAEDYAGAVDYQTRALKLFEAFSPDNLPGLAKVHNNLGFLKQKEGKLDKAAEEFRAALTLFGKAYPAGHPDIAVAKVNLGGAMLDLGKFDEARTLLADGLAIRQRWLPADHPEVALSHVELANLWIRQSDWPRAVTSLTAAANIFVARAARQESGRGSSTRNDVALNAFGFTKLVKALHRQKGADIDAAFIAAQRAIESAAATSLAQMATRSAKGDPRLSDLVRSRQDLIAAWHALDKELVAAFSGAASSAGTVEQIRQRLTDMDARIGAMDRDMATRFPEFSALANPAPLKIAEVAADLRPDEALVLFLVTPAYLTMPEETFVFVVTRTERRWLRSDLGASALAREVASLRCGLDYAGAWQAAGLPCAELTGITYTADDDRAGKPLPFAPARAHALYTSLLGGAADLLKDKHLLVVPSGALTQLPFHVLVTEKPKDADLGATAWLARTHAVTVLPSVSSLKALRRNAHASAATEPFLGFGNPILTGDCGATAIPESCPDAAVKVAAAGSTITRTRSPGRTGTASRFVRDGRANVAELRKLCPLPDTELELKCVAKSLGATEASLRLGRAMTETALKKLPLTRYRVIHFATHGLLAGETAQLASERAEPALVMTPPDVPSDDDDGLLTASEIASLKLDADWVVMSACNTAAAGGDNSEALSGLARAFFYAGARALIVSHWPVNSYAATLLTSHTFAEMRRDPAIGRSEAFRRAMVALMSGPDKDWAAHPAVWAPFVVVGEGGGVARR